MIISGPTLPFLMSNETQSSESRQDARCALHSVRGGIDMGSQEGKYLKHYLGKPLAFNVYIGRKIDIISFQIKYFQVLLWSSGLLSLASSAPQAQFQTQFQVRCLQTKCLIVSTFYIYYICTLSKYESRQDYDYSLDPPPRQSRPPSRGGGGSLRGQQPPPATERPETTTPVAILKQINE